jgi:hypothetical protein
MAFVGRQRHSSRGRGSGRTGYLRHHQHHERTAGCEHAPGCRQAVTNTVRFVALLLGFGLVVARVSDAVAFNDVTASTCSIAAGRDVTQSTMNVYCRDPTDVQEIARLLADSKTIAAARQEAELRAEKLAGEAQTTKQQMLIFLSILAKQEVKPDQAFTCTNRRSIPARRQVAPCSRCAACSRNLNGA